MEISSSDPDIETIYNRIAHNQWNLQPDFQRGEVWSDHKKLRLIDTILRGWHVPPIHLVRIPEAVEEVVLDGQQRLAAIRDFRKGLLTFNGKFPPHDGRIESLHGRTYDKLPEDVQRFFNRQTIRVLTIIKYEPDEPGELFFRLNQPTGLTTAEQRNAFFGPVRSQIRSLVALGEEFGLNEYSIGFSNSRMAYDDVMARVAATLTWGSLWERSTAGRIAELYRGREALSDEIYGRLRRAVMAFCATLRSAEKLDQPAVHERPWRSSYRIFSLNKATLFSWLLFFIEGDINDSLETSEPLAEFLLQFESLREQLKYAEDPLKRKDPYFDVDRAPYLLHIYNDRASARVADATSIVLRDAISWIFAGSGSGIDGIGSKCLEKARSARDVYRSLGISHGTIIEPVLLESLKNANWGSNL